MLDPREVTFVTWYGSLSVAESNLINFLGEPQDVYLVLNQGLPKDNSEEITELRETIQELEKDITNLEEAHRYELENLREELRLLEADNTRLCKEIDALELANDC